MSPPAKILWWYERLADSLIANPQLTLGEIAAQFGCTQAWLSTIKNSDVFKEYWTRRSNEASKDLLGELRSKGMAAAEMAVDALNRRLELEADSLPIPTLLEVADISMKRFGYDSGGKKGQAPTVNNFNLGVVTPTELAEARARMRALRSEVLEALPNGTES